jgi:broad specificity phosphatase PhoE
MHQRIPYLTHLQVLVDPAKGIMDWSQSDLGRRRVVSLANTNTLDGTTVVISSAETKANETVRLLARAVGCRMVMREIIHENNRSSTGFLPPKEFEAVADKFFAYPDGCVSG